MHKTYLFSVSQYLQVAVSMESQRGRGLMTKKSRSPMVHTKQSSTQTNLLDDINELKDLSVKLLVENAALKMS